MPKSPRPVRGGEGGAKETKTMLVELTPVVEVVVRLKDFLNVDLHKQGYYHCRSRLKLAPEHGPAKTEVGWFRG